MRLIGLAVVLVASLQLATLAVHAQPVGQQVKIGVLCAGACGFGGGAVGYRPLTDALDRVGLVEGRSLVWDIGGVVASENAINAEAVKLVSRRPDLILVWAGNVAAAQAAKAATGTIPIVLMAVPDVVERGLVASLNRPGGNITGTTVPMYDLMIKQIEVLKEINPRLRGLVAAHGVLDGAERETLDRLRVAAGSLRLDEGVTVTDLGNVEHALVAAPAGGCAFVIIGD